MRLTGRHDEKMMRNDDEKVLSMKKSRQRDSVFNKKFLLVKLVLGQPNALETFSTQAIEAKKLIFFSFTFL